MGVQELKAQAPDVAGRFEQLAGLQGYFQYAEKKGYSGVALYSRHEPSEVIVGLGEPEFDAEGRYVELRFDTLSKKPASSAATFRAARRARSASRPSSGFSSLIYPQLQRMQRRARVRAVRRRQHRAPRDRPEELERQPEEQRLPARGARLDEQAAGRGRPGRRLPPSAPRGTARAATPGGATAARRGPRTWAGASTTSWPARRWPLQARRASIYKEQWFSDHAPLTIEYDWTL